MTNFHGQSLHPTCCQSQVTLDKAWREYDSDLHVSHPTKKRVILENHVAGSH